MQRVVVIAMLTVAMLAPALKEALSAQSKSLRPLTAPIDQSGSSPISGQVPETSFMQRERLELDREKSNLDRALQRERLQFDREKFTSDKVLEENKLKIESDKAFWSAWAIVIPLVAGLLTVCLGVWSQYQQVKLQFELKVAELAFSASTPYAVLNRAKALKAMFVKRIPDTFLGSFNPDEYGGRRESSEEKKFFLELILKYPNEKSEILQLWGQLFPGDQWLERVNGANPKTESTPEHIEPALSRAAHVEPGSKPPRAAFTRKYGFCIRLPG